MISSWQRDIYKRNPAGVFLYAISRSCTGFGEAASEKRVHRPEKPVCLVDFSPYAIDTRSFPYNVWRKISRNVLLDDSEELLMAGDGQGEYSLRSEIADYLHHARGVNCRPENIVLGAGNEYLEILLTQLLGGNKTVLMENPGYPQAYHTFRNMGYRVVTVPADEQGLSGGTVRAAAPELVYMMPSHQFPTGSVMPLGRRLELLAWAAEQEERYLIEDDHDSEYRYRGKPIPSLQSVDGLGKVIYLGTFSKSIAPSLRISYMVLPQQLIERHLNKMRGIYRGRHDFLIGELKKRSWVLSVSGDHAGLHVLVEADTGCSEREICERAAAQGVKVSGLGEYALTKDGGGGRNHPVLLLGYGSLTEQEIQMGLTVLDSILDAQESG